MMEVALEVSLYPLAEDYLKHPVHDFVELLEKHGCNVKNGPMSSVVTGDSVQVFEALRFGYEQAAQRWACVLIVKACNACPL